jgi:hypothetical protein
LEDKIYKEYPQEIKRLTERIVGYKTDMETAAKNPAKLPESDPRSKDYFPPMTINGNIYGEKSEAGKAVIEACKAMASPAPTLIGSYRGFTMILSFETFTKEYRVTLGGALSHEVKLGTDIRGNITRIDNVLEGLAESWKRCEGKLADTQAQFETAKGEVDRPFPQEAEYQEKSARLKELNVLLKLDERGHEIFEAEPDESDMAEQPRGRGQER